MKYGFILIALVIIVVSSLAGGLFGRFEGAFADTSITTRKVSEDYREALDVIDKNYGGNSDHEKITESSIQGMLWSLDPHSAFFTSEQFRKLYEEQASQFYGIGVSILQRRDGVYVQSVIPNTPADKAGIRYGDKFLEIEGKDATEWTSPEVSRNVRGERGTTVKVKIERATSERPVDFEIVRGGVPLPSIRNYFMLPNGVGYVGLTGGFQETTAAELDDAIGALQKQGMTTLLLDLRGNPGGLLNQSVDVMSRFIAAGETVVSVKGRSRYAQARELKAQGGRRHELPIIVMINGGSASASEIVAGAVQDYSRGIVVGTDSFGKGLVQRVFQLPLSTGLTLTTARYYSPFGRSLQKDYSSGSIYEYYSGNSSSDDPEEAKPKPAGSPVTLPDGRVLYGGRGIEPDIKIEADKLTPVNFRINDAAFFFVRQLVAGKIPDNAGYKVEKQNFQLALPPDAFPVSDQLFAEFIKYTVADSRSGLTAENINKHIDYAKMRIREELATANYSNEAGFQVLLESDSQVLKAVESIEEARRYYERYIAMH